MSLESSNWLYSLLDFEKSFDRREFLEDTHIDSIATALLTIPRHVLVNRLHKLIPTSLITTISSNGSNNDDKAIADYDTNKIVYISTAGILNVISKVYSMQIFKQTTQELCDSNFVIIDEDETKNKKKSKISGNHKNSNDNDNNNSNDGSESESENENYNEESSENNSNITNNSDDNDNDYDSDYDSLRSSTNSKKRKRNTALMVDMYFKSPDSISSLFHPEIFPQFLLNSKDRKIPQINLNAILLNLGFSVQQIENGLENIDLMLIPVNGPWGHRKAFRKCFSQYGFEDSAVSENQKQLDKEMSELKSVNKKKWQQRAMELVNKNPNNHWSLLCYQRSSNTIFYYDSIISKKYNMDGSLKSQRLLNQKAAKEIVLYFKAMKIIPEDCEFCKFAFNDKIRQQSGWECGYVVISLILIIITKTPPRPISDVDLNVRFQNYLNMGTNHNLTKVIIKLIMDLLIKTDTKNYV